MGEKVGTEVNQVSEYQLVADSNLSSWPMM